MAWKNEGSTLSSSLLCHQTGFSFWFSILEISYSYHSTSGPANFESIVSFLMVLTVRLNRTNKGIRLTFLAGDKLLERFQTPTPMKSVTHHLPLYWLEAYIWFVDLFLAFISATPQWTKAPRQWLNPESRSTSQFSASPSATHFPVFQHIPAQSYS